jgi:hypothetical protein
LGSADAGYHRHMRFQNDDAGMREVFRGDLSAVQLAAGVLEEAGIEAQRRWEIGGGAQIPGMESPFGADAVLLVPSIAYDEARELLAHFEDPEPDHPTELSEELEQNSRKRKAIAFFILLLFLGPLAVTLVRMVVALLRGELG